MLTFILNCVMLTLKVGLGSLIIFFGLGIASFLFLTIIAIIGYLLEPKKKG